ncbi:MAG: O-antigen ligase family protein [Negativicutes bacterium]|nr:O-antigen ligase family protein [Negativicutes bacterium]
MFGLQTAAMGQTEKSQVSELITLLLLAAAILTPLIIVPYGADYFYQPKAIFLYLLSLIMLTVDLYCQRKISLPKDAINILLLVYLALVFLATCFSTDLRISILGRVRRCDGIFTIYTYAVFFLFARHHYRYQPKHLDWLFASATLLSVYGIFQHFGLDPIPRDPQRIGWGLRPFVTFGNPDFFGAYLSLVFPLSWFAYLATKKLRYLGAAALLFLCFLYVSTRSAWVGLAFGTLLLFWFVYSLKLSKKALLLSLLVFLLLFAGVNYKDGGSMVNRLQSIATDAAKVITKTEDYEKAGAGRIYIWTRVWGLIKARPWLGYGPETLGEVFLAAYRDDMLEHYHKLYLFDKAHNEYLHIAVTTGIPSLFCYLGFLFLCCWRTWLQLWRAGQIWLQRSQQKQTEARAFPMDRKYLIQAGLLIAVVSYCVQAAMNISVVSVGYLFWILLGIMVSGNRNPLQNQQGEQANNEMAK